MEFTAHLEVVPVDLAVVIEDGDECAITVNGTAVACSGDEYFVDRSFKSARIALQARVGDNRIEITREFEPPSQPRFRLGGLFHTASGVELESVYLTGSFGVSGSRSVKTARPKSARFSNEFRLVAESTESGGDLLGCGYPFFAGRLTLSRAIDLEAPRAGERIFLRVRRVDSSVAIVHVNGSKCGYLAWDPYEVEITDAVRAGENTVSIELATSLRNMLGPHHRPSGEPDQVWADGWTGLSSKRRRDTKIVSGTEWWEDRNSGLIFWTDDYFFVPFGIAEGTIEYRTIGE